MEDSLAFFPFYNPAPVIRQEVLDAHPELEAILNSFLSYLDDQTMSALNARVDIGADGIFNSGDEETPTEVARTFLQRIGLINIALTDQHPTDTGAESDENGVEDTGRAEGVNAASSERANDVSSETSDAGEPERVTPTITEGSRDR